MAEEFDDTLPASAPPPNEAEEIGHYRLLAKLGEGGMGTVYRAFDKKLGRIVALKLLHRDKPISLLRFRREARIVAQLAHPHIAEIYEFSEQPPYIAMRYVEGAPIDRAEGDRIAALKDAARAVHRAHEQGVIHRDLKPANILVDGKGHAYVLDFGIAKRIADEHELTRTGNITGTPAYMAPEQAMGAKTVDARTDVYGLGATLYHILTGRPPHLGESAYQIIRKVIEEDPAPAGDRELAWIAMRALEKEPADRYPTAGEMADDLDRFLSHRPVTARPPSFFYRVKKAVVRHPLVSGLSLLLLLATAALVWVSARGGESWVTVVNEDFSHELGPEWKLLRGELTVHEGALCSRNGHAVFDADLGDRVSVDVSAIVQSDSKDPRELSAFISGSDAAGLANGYSAELFILDELNQAFHGITRLRQFAERIPAEMPERGRSYRVSIERASSRVAIGLDGTRLVEIDDPAPLTGPDHNRFGIGSKCDHIHYDNLEIRLPLEEARRFISRMLVKNDYRRVESAIGSLLAVESDPRQRSAMSLLRAKALLRLGRIDEAEAVLGTIEVGLLDGEGRLHQKCIVAEVLAERGRFAEAFGVLRTERQTEGRWWTVSERMRTVGRSIVRRLDRVSREERERILRLELEKELAPFSVDLAYALADEHRLKLADLEPKVRGVAAVWFGADAAIAQEAAAQEAGNLLYYSRWQAAYLTSVALWLIAEGRPDEALSWLDRADAADKFSGPSENATFVYAIRGDAERVKARIAGSDLDNHYQIISQARSLLALDDVAGAKKAYRDLLHRYGNRSDLQEIVEARLVLGEMSEAELDAAAKSTAYDLPLDYAATRSAVVGIRRELAGDTAGAIEAYRAAEAVRLPDIALVLLARNRLARLAP